MKFNFNLKNTNNILKNADVEINYKIVNGQEESQYNTYKMFDWSFIDFSIKFNNFGDINLIKELYFSFLINYPKPTSLNNLAVTSKYELLNEKKYYENLTSNNSWTDLDGVSANDVFHMIKLSEENYNNSDYPLSYEVVSTSMLFDDDDEAVYFDIYDLFKENSNQIYFRIFMNENCNIDNYRLKKKLLEKYKTDLKGDLNCIFGVMELDLKKDSNFVLDGLSLNNTSIKNVLPNNKCVTDFVILDNQDYPVKLNYIYNPEINEDYYFKYKLLSNFHCFIENKDFELYLKDIYGNKKVFYKVNSDYINSKYGLNIPLSSEIYFNFNDLSYIEYYSNRFYYFINSTIIDYSIQDLTINNQENQNIKLFKADHIYYTDVNQYSILWENGMIVNIIDDFTNEKILRCDFTGTEKEIYFVWKLNIKQEMNLVFNSTTFYLTDITIHQNQIGKLVKETELLNNSYTYDSNKNIIKVIDNVLNKTLKLSYTNNKVNIKLYKGIGNNIKELNYKTFTKYSNYIELESLESIKRTIYFDQDKEIFLYEDIYKNNFDYYVNNFFYCDDYVIPTKLLCKSNSDEQLLVNDKFDNDDDWIEENIFNGFNYNRLDNYDSDNLNHILGETAYFFNLRKNKLTQKIVGIFKQGERYNLEIWIKGDVNNTANLNLSIDSSTLNYSMIVNHSEYKPYLFSFSFLYDCKEINLSISVDEENQLYKITNLKLYKTSQVEQSGSYSFTSFNVLDNNNKTKFSKNNNSIIEYFYYDNGLLKEEVSCKFGNSIKYLYDDKSRLITKEFWIQNKLTYSQKFEYYDNNLLKKYIDENENITIYNYDCTNRIMDIVYPNGQSIRYNYDDYSKMVKSTYGINDLSLVCDYQYGNEDQNDKDSKLLTSLNIQGKEKYEFEYDVLDRTNKVQYIDINHNEHLLETNDYINSENNNEIDNQSFDKVKYIDHTHVEFTSVNTYLHGTLIPNLYLPHEYIYNYDNNTILTSVTLNSKNYLNYTYNKDKINKIKYYNQEGNVETTTLKYLNDELKSINTVNNVNNNYKETNTDIYLLENGSKKICTTVGNTKILSQQKSKNGHNIFDELEQFNNFYHNDYIMGVMSKPIYTKEVSYSKYSKEVDSENNISVLSFINNNEKIIMPIEKFNKNRITDFDYTNKNNVNNSYLINDNMDIIILFKIENGETPIFSYNFNENNKAFLINENKCYIKESVLERAPYYKEVFNFNNFDKSKWHMLYANVRVSDLSLTYTYKIDNIEVCQETCNFSSYSDLINAIPLNIVLGSDTHEISFSEKNKLQILYFSICNEEIPEDVLNKLYINIIKYDNKSKIINGCYSLVTNKEYDEIIFDNNLISMCGCGPSRYTYKINFNDNKSNQLFTYDVELEKNVLNVIATKDYQNIHNCKQIGYDLNLKDKFNLFIKFKYNSINNSTKHTLFFSKNINYKFHIYILNNKLNINYENNDVQCQIVLNEININNNEWINLSLKYYDNLLIINCNENIIEKPILYNLNLNNEIIYIGNSLNSNEVYNLNMEYLNGYVEKIKFSENVNIDLYNDEELELKNYYNSTGLINKKVYTTNSNNLVKKYYKLESNYKTSNIPNVEENFDGSKTYYAYNKLGYLKKITTINTLGVTLNSKEYMYDDKGQLIKEVIIENDDLINNTIEYEYDDNGNILHLTEFNNNVVTKKLNYYYSPNMPNILLSVKSESLLGEETEVFDLQYIENKPLVLEKLIFNNEEHSIKYYGQNIVKIGNNNYYYGATGNRVRKELANNNFMNYYYLDNLIIHTDFNIDGVQETSITYLYDEQNNLFGLSMNNEYYFYDKDITGTINGIVDKNGICMVKYTYNAFGKPKIFIPYDINNEKYSTAYSLSKANIFLYKGYVYDVETNLFLVSSRYYSPELCRWISPDDIEYLDPESVNGLNLYCYCLNDPVNYVDPDGHFPVLAAILCGLAIVGMGLTIGGVASDNNTMTAIGLTMVAIPAMISGVGALFSGGTYLSIIGGVTAGTGLLTGLFATAEYQEAFTGNNWMLDAGMSEEWYNGLMLTTAAIATAGTIASSVLTSIGNVAKPDQMINSISKNPNRWKQVKEVKEAATGRKYRGGTSYYRNYINKWTGAKSGSHIIIRNGKILHKLHYHFWIS